MTEIQLRQMVVDTAKAWLGVRAGSAEHANMLKIYNAQRPLPRGTKMLEEWPWCATFVSAVVLKCDLRDIMPTEMSCPKMRTLYEQLGRWVEDDAYVPSPGDIVLYDWDDGKNYATTDNTGDPDHVGIVTACDGKIISVIEGNVNNKVAMRALEVNGRFIRGFCIPDFASKATEVEPENHTMNGIDISGHQYGIDLSKVPCDFVICKATGGNGFVSPDFKRQIEQALSLNKCAGAYHFARDRGYTDGTPEQEAQHFLDVVNPYIGKIMLVLDWEADAVGLGAEWAKRWLDYVFDKTGIRAMIYMSKSPASTDAWAAVAENHPLWMAQYAISTDPNYKPGYTPVNGYLSDPPGAKDCGQWGESITIRQYTSMGFLEGWKERLDLNLAYIDRSGWEKLCRKAEEDTPGQPTLDELAWQVRRGVWGNGSERRRRLTQAGYDYVAIQTRVNEMIAKKENCEPSVPPTSEELTAAEIEALALATIRGDFGNGATRRANLGAKYDVVMTRVNAIYEERKR